MPETADDANSLISQVNQVMYGFESAAYIIDNDRVYLKCIDRAIKQNNRYSHLLESRQSRICLAICRNDNKSCDLFRLHQLEIKLLFREVFIRVTENDTHWVGLCSIFTAVDHRAQVWILNIQND